MLTLKNYVHKNVPSFFQWQKKHLILMGLHLPENHKNMTLFILYDITIILFMVTTLLLIELTQIILKFNDFKVVVINMAQFFLHVCIEIQIILWFFVKNKLFKVIDMIERPSFQFKTFSIESIAFAPYEHNFESPNYEDLQFLKKTDIELNAR